MNHTAVQPLEVEVVETVKGFSSPPESFPCDDMSNAGLELDDLFGIEDLKWTLERETASSLFDIELANLGFSAKDQDSEIEASTASSPDRTSSDSRIKKRQSQSSHMINKNAVAARLNRLRKKEYVTSLEKKVGVLSSENNVLRHENSQLTKRVEELEDETRDPTQTTTTTPCPESVRKWRRKRQRVACVCTWTRTTSQWSSAPSVQRVRAHRSKCRVKYLCVFRYWG